MPRPLSSTEIRSSLRIDDVDFGAETGQRFVDGVVDDLGDEMMQAALGGVADVHSGAFANRFESFENLDGLGAIAVRRLLYLP